MDPSSPASDGRAGRKLPLLLAALATALVLLSLCVFNPPLLRQLDLKIYDAFLSAHADGTHADVTAIVDVDEKSLREQGQWPWPRYRLARLVQTLLDAGAGVVALDIMLSEKDRTSLDAVLDDLRREGGVTASLPDVPGNLRDNDLLLARTLRGKPVVLGAFLVFRDEDASLYAAGNPLPRGVGLAAKDASGDALPVEEILLAGRSMVAPLPELSDAAAVGFFNAQMDQDGLIRRVPVLARVEGGRNYANLSLRALMLHLKKRSLKLVKDDYGGMRLHVGGLALPVTPQGFMLLPWRGPARTFPYISAGDVLAGRFDPGAVRGRIVFVGTSAAGQMDIRSTPLETHLPGVETHATIVDAALSGRTLEELSWTPALNVGFIVLASLLCLPLFGLSRLSVATAGGLALAGGAYAASRYLFGTGLWVSPLWAILSVSAQAIVITAARFWLSEKDKRRIRNIFSHYVSPEVVSRIVDRGEASLRGEQRELTVMFTDLRGFTSLSEKLTPVQVVSLLNRYFTPMTALVRESGGTLDKFIGDALMAFWNAPLDVDGHPEKAVRAALAMQRSLAGMNAELQRDFGLTLRMGAGIHTGQAHVGNMGSDDLTNYTAVGDTVNLASRLEGLCSRYGVTLVTSGETASRCGGGLVLRELARLRVKGRAEPVDVFTVLSEEEAETQKRLLADWKKALQLYRAAVAKRDDALLAKAADAFAALCASHPGPLHQAYADACADLSSRPAETWSDVWTLTGK